MDSLSDADELELSNWLQNDILYETSCFNAGWDKLYNFGILGIQRVLYNHTCGKLFNSKQYSMLYTIAFRLCHHQHEPLTSAGQLYNKYITVLEEYLENIVLEDIKGKFDCYLISTIAYHWNTYKIYVKWLGRIFQPIDSLLCTYQEEYYYVFAKGLMLFYEFIIVPNTKIIVHTILEETNLQRQGQCIHVQRLRTCTMLFIELGAVLRNRKIDSVKSLRKANTDLYLYINVLEQPLLVETKKYYTEKSLKWIESCSFFEYLLNAEMAIDKERCLLSNIYSSSSENQMIASLVEVLLNNQVKKYMVDQRKEIVRGYFENGTSKELNRVYRLFMQVDCGISMLANALHQVIVSTIGEKVHLLTENQLKLKNINQKRYVEDAFLDSVANLRNYYSDMIKHSFHDNITLSKALHSGIEMVLQNELGTDRLSRIMSNCCDRLLRGIIKMTDIETEHKVQDILGLFNYLSDKDVFVEYYRDKLAKRLLSRIVCIDIERIIVCHLKALCGRQFTSKLECMLKDYNVSKLLDQQYNKTTTKPTKIDFHVQILTAGIWPNYQKLNPILPTKVQHHYNQFHDYYQQHRNGRKLDYVYTHGEVIINATLLQRSFEIQIVPIQAIVLLCFQAGHDTYSYSAILEKTRLDTITLKAVLHSFINATSKLLTLNDGYKNLTNDTLITLTTDYKPNSSKIRIPMPSYSKSSVKVQQSINIDRSYLIDATIVRIMKSRKKISHISLVTNLMAQLTMFQPDDKLIRNRINNLICREYLRRSAEDVAYYEYI